MKREEIFAHVDHTLLKPTADQEEILRLCEEAIAYHMAAVCIPPGYVKWVRCRYANLKICTVIGFPLGYTTTAVKVFEATDAIANGADEIDMVINRCAVKNREYESITKEIAAVKKACGNHILKVIAETCDLTKEEKIKVCQCVTNGGGDYIKTSTGFGKEGATQEDVRLFSEQIGASVKIKAAGGIRTAEDLVKYLDLGCQRIGASCAIAALEGQDEC